MVFGLTQNVLAMVCTLAPLAIRMAVLLLILLALAILFGIIVGDRFAKPIRELQKATEKIMTGGMDYRINLQTGDEIQEFAESFNTMVEDLREKQKNLLFGVKFE